MKAVIYARYSCDRQNEQSIEGQLHECYAYAEKHGITVVKEYIDRALSGRSAEHRTAFQQMIQEFLTDQYTDIRAADCAFFQPADRPRDVSVFRNLQFDRLIHAEPSQGTSHPIPPQEIS